MEPHGCHYKTISRASNRSSTAPSGRSYRQWQPPKPGFAHAIDGCSHCVSHDGIYRIALKHSLRKLAIAHSFVGPSYRQGDDHMTWRLLGAADYRWLHETERLCVPRKKKEGDVSTKLRLIGRLRPWRHCAVLFGWGQGIGMYWGIQPCFAPSCRVRRD